MSYALHRMTIADAPLTVEWMVRQYGFDRAEVETWVRDLHFNWPLSVKATDDNGDVIVAKRQCGNCGWMFFTENPNFCENCGKQVKWE